MNYHKEMPKKIKLLAIDHHTELGGSEINLINIFKHIDPQNIELQVACPPWGPFFGKLKAEGFTVRPITLRSSFLATNMIRSASAFQIIKYISKSFLDIARFLFNFMKILRSFKPDVIYLNTLKAGILCSIPCKLFGIPSVQHVQDLLVKEDFNPVTLFITKLLFNIPARIIAISNAVKEALISIGVNSEKIVMIYNGTDISSFTPPSHVNLFKAKYMQMSNLPSVGVVGRLMRWKGQSLFIKAAAKVMNKAGFYVVGGLFWEDTIYGKELENLSERLGLRERVHFTDHIDNIREAMHALDIVVSTSTKPEPFGLTIIEAMAASKPVIAPRFGAAPEIIVHGETGLLFTPGDADSLALSIDYLLKNPRKAIEMGRRGRERALRMFIIETTYNNIKREIIAALI